LRVRAILNPRAGVRARRTREAVEQGRPGWKDYAVYLTRAPGHATDLAAEAVAGGADVVLAVGGDGTVNEVARGILGSSAAVGVVPVGSGNGLARALGLPRQPERALAALEGGVVRTMDVGLLNGQPFLNVAGVGFDAAVGQSFHEHGRRGGRRGLLGYLNLSLRELGAFRPVPLVLELGGERLALEPFVLTFANGPQYGSGAVINPGARLDDGRLEVVVFDHASLPRLLLAASRMFTGGLAQVSGYRNLGGVAATVTAERALPVHVDGDPSAPATRIEVALRPQALRIVVPAAVASDPAGPFAQQSATDPALRPGPPR
jgi:YegS/Rv2252/BmrU family lipid kinase